MDHVYAEHIIQNVRLDELQAEINIVRRNSNNLRYADDTTLMAESKKELNSLLKLNVESQTCPDLCDPMDCKPASFHPWDFQGKDTGGLPW